MLGRIMVPVDGSSFAEGALATAARLARLHGSGIHLVRVHEPALPVVTPGVPWYDPGLELELDTEGRRYLELLRERIDAQERWRTVTAYLHGPVTESLTRYIRAREIDLVVMTTHARGGVRRASLGSVADGLVRHSASPVLLLPPDRECPPAPVPGPVFRRVLLPLDGGVAGDRMTEHAILVAGTTGVEYTLLRVVRRGAPSAPAPLRRGEDPGSREQRAMVEVALGIKAEELRARGARVRPQVVVNDDAAEGILGYAAAQGFDLVAMATRSRGGLERLVLGSVADRVLREVRTATLVWNPGEVPALEVMEELPSAAGGRNAAHRS